MKIGVNTLLLIAPSHLKSIPFTIMVNKSRPVWVSLPNLAHLFNWNALSFRQHEIHKECHHHYKEGKEDKQAKLHVTEQG